MYGTVKQIIIFNPSDRVEKMVYLWKYAHRNEQKSQNKGPKIKYPLGEQLNTFFSTQKKDEKKNLPNTVPPWENPFSAQIYFSGVLFGQVYISRRKLIPQK